MSYSSDRPYIKAKEIFESNSGRDYNEADTRHRIIDEILHEVLSFPVNSINCEKYIKDGYADYIIQDRRSDAILIIEAKREGYFFTIPNSQLTSSFSRIIPMNELLTDENINAAITQVHAYSMSEGIEFACITNGIEWIFFKTFERKKDWKKLNAFVITGLQYFFEKYTESQNNFNYRSICDDSSLHLLLGTQYPDNRETYFPKNKIVDYDYEVRANTLAPQMRPIINKYFGVMELDEPEFIRSCYIEDRSYNETVKSFEYVFSDTIIPFLEQYGVKENTFDSKGGAFGTRLNANLHSRRSSDVIILYGGAGSGKSTFLKKILFIDPPPQIIKFASIVYIDLLEIPEDKTKIENYIMEQLIEGLDIENVMNGTRAQLLELFDDRYSIAKKQELDSLDEKSEIYNIQLNKLVSEWKKDRNYCAKRLAERIRGTIKSPVVIIDNTDQYKEHQDYCFSLAFNLSVELKCTVVIAMREERFYESRIKGMLDAHQTEGLHIRSPNQQNVYNKRIDYVIDLLGNKERFTLKYPQIDYLDVPKMQSLFKILRNEFLKDVSYLSNFLNACAHGNTRFSLELFRGFITSGYLNIKEILPKSTFTFLMHQILRPMMIPDRYYYDEEKSNMPNLLRLRSKQKASHFTSLRLLNYLTNKSSNGEYSYTTITEVKAFFIERLKMKDDFEKNIGALLRHGLIESDNGIDHYSNSINKIRITSYGLYMYKEILSSFAYLDLVCTDTGVYNQEISNYLIKSANDELIYLQNNRKTDRVYLRLAKVDEFLKYLDSEEVREQDLYPEVIEYGSFAGRIIEVFNEDKKRVIKSLDKNT